MDRQDASAVPWMAGFTRDPWPKHVVWNQSSRVHDSFAWLAIDPKQGTSSQKIQAVVEGSTITLTRSTPSAPLTLRLADPLVDLDTPVRIVVNGKQIAERKIDRSARVIWGSLAERADPTACGTAVFDVPAAE